MGDTGGAMPRTRAFAKAPLTVIGLMSGTSLDGVDAALLVTDGDRVLARGKSVSLPYPPRFRARLHEGLIRAAKAKGKRRTPFFQALERELTDWHVKAVAACRKANRKRRGDITLIGFHGQTLFHDPRRGITWQFGDAKRLAGSCGIEVIADFRGNDVRQGGEGAPLAPLYHRALFAGPAKGKPIAVLNLGGVANVTWLWKDSIRAFDCGPGNALLDDWMMKRTGKPFDRGGKTAARGKVHPAILKRWLRHRYFLGKPPKSLDRNTFTADALEKLSPADGAATLAAFTVEAVAKARAHFPKKPERWIVTGGGRHNTHVMKRLRARLGVPVKEIEGYGLNGDALEAEAFGFLAVRSLRKLPLSLPETTGVKTPMTGGRRFRVRTR
jgi:anhydro-N-acetylmuramic acid kinase